MGMLLSQGNEFLRSHPYSGPLAAAEISICNSGLAKPLSDGGAPERVPKDSNPTISPLAKASRRRKYLLFCNNLNFELKYSFHAEPERRWLLPGLELPDLAMEKPSRLII